MSQTRVVLTGPRLALVLAVWMAIWIVPGGAWRYPAAALVLAACAWQAIIDRKKYGGG